tara:strand:- start:2135 stop:2335 length:201 start_codon:yes stop_codon:yes gene_type:complete
MTYQEKISVREKILERMDTLQHFFELEDYETCREILPSVSKFFSALTDEDKEYIQVVQSVVNEGTK